MAKLLSNNIIQSLFRYYAFALEYLRDLLIDNHISHLSVRYPDGGDACFNVHRRNGDAELITGLRLKDGYLAAIGGQGTEYPLGETIDDQDNYVLCNIDALLRAADERIKELRRDCITIDHGARTKNILAAQIDVFFRVTRIGSVPVDASGPAIRIGENEELRCIEAQAVQTETPGSAHRFRHPMDALSVKELIQIIRVLNEHIIRRYNEE